ncbi:EGF-like repeat and discoidin I-like domain-containing protein 3 [Diadema setosum]|uniref:EGF-like repeat and discoidin I-like domain-containing protein 3 n=1 Tax=Diadema setosum TaxID=31175 RepID=UPI003B3A3E67
MPDRAGGGWHSHPVHSEAYAIIPGDICVAAAGTCLSNPCRNGTTCTEIDEGFNCTCPDGYKGVRCERDAFIHSVELLGGQSNNEGRVVFTIRQNPTSLRLAHYEEWMKNVSILICRYLGFKGVYGTVGGDSFAGSSRDVYAKMGVVFCPPDATNITDCWMEEEREYGGRDQSIGIVCCDGNSRVSVGSPLGLESGAIPDSRITGSTSSYNYIPPYYGRLNGLSSFRFPVAVGGSRYITINLGKKHLVTGVITQGRAGTNEFVTSYYVVSYNDGVWTKYVDIDTGSYKIFSANYDDSSAVTHHFQSPVIAITVKIEIIKYVSSYISLRMEILGYGPLPENIGAFEVEPCLPTNSGERLGVQDSSIPDSNLTASSALSSSYTAPYGRLASNSGWIPANGDNDMWVKIFPTNYDYNTMVTTPFPVPIRASYVRIHPVAWYGRITMRYEVLGYQ